MNRPGIAAVLSLLLPGLGQAWAGARWRGLVIALPVVLGVVALVGIALDPVGALDTVLAPGMLGLILALIVAIGIYHLAAIQDAWRTASVLAARVDASEIQTIQLTPPTYPEYLTTAAIQLIHDRVATVFDEPAASPSPTPDSTPQPCPGP